MSSGSPHSKEMHDVHSKFTRPSHLQRWYRGFGSRLWGGSQLSPNACTRRHTDCSPLSGQKGSKKGRGDGRYAGDLRRVKRV